MPHLERFESDDVKDLHAPFNSQHVIPMPKEVWANPKGSATYDYDQYEQVVDEYIKKNKLKKDETFRVDHPSGHDEEGPNFYKYLGPKSGGRKDWMLIQGAPKGLVS